LVHIAHHLSYAMFSPAWPAGQDAAMTARRFVVPAAEAGTQPDLSAWFMRFEEIPSTRELISCRLLVCGQRTPHPLAFRKVIEASQAAEARARNADGQCRQGGPPLRWPAGRPGVWVRAGARRVVLKRRTVVPPSPFGPMCAALGIKVGRFFVPEELCAAVVEEFPTSANMTTAYGLILDCTNRARGPR